VSRSKVINMLIFMTT